MIFETAKGWLKWATGRISLVSETPLLDAQILLRTACMTNQTTVAFAKEIFLNTQQLDQLESLLDRRIEGEPIAYIVGEKEFWSLSLKVTKDTLIPRPETELLVECALDRIGFKDPVKVLDLGTGSGAIALSLALERPAAQITATDVSQKALEVARENAKFHEVRNVIFRSGDWLDAVPMQLYSLIACNPPYVALNDPALDRLQTKFEPQLALISENGGMAAIEQIISTAPQSLAPEGWLLLEHGYQQQFGVERLLCEAKFDSIVQYYDITGNPRVTAARTTN